MIISHKGKSICIYFNQSILVCISKETTNDDTAHEIQRDEYAVSNVLKDVHNSGPALHCDTLKDGDEGIAEVIKVCYSVVEL